MLAAALLMMGIAAASAGVIGASRAVPGGQTTALRDLLVQDGCPPPCLLGIDLGRMTIAEGLVRLRGQTWVAEVYHQGRPGTATFWRWRDDFPLAAAILTSSITSSSRGIDLPTPADDRWDQIDLITTLPLGAVVAALGPPDQVAVNVLFNTGMASNPAGPPPIGIPSSISGMRYVAAWTRLHIYVTTTYLPCPIDAAFLWRQPVTITVAVKAPITFGVLYPFDDQRPPGWMFHLLPGERCG